MHAELIAFILLCVAAIVAGLGRAWALALLAAGLAVMLAPHVF